MYAKLFGSILASSIWDEDSDTCKVWVTLLAMADRNGDVYASASGVAHQARVPVETALASLKRLESPDPASTDLIRAPENEGRRIERTMLGWRILNYRFYKDLKDADTRREQNRVAKRKSRQKADVSTGQHSSAPVTSVTPSEAATESTQRKKEIGSRHSVPPDPSTVFEYAKERAAAGNPPIDPLKFIDYHSARGWKYRNGQPVVDWQAAFRTFEANAPRFGDIAPTKGADLGAANPRPMSAADKKQLAEDLERQRKIREEDDALLRAHGRIK